METDVTEVELVCFQIKRLRLTHANLVALIAEVSNFAECTEADNVDFVVELLDRAKAACEEVYLPSHEERAERMRA
jgi:hypothetical protein